MILLVRPAPGGPFLDRWIVLIGLAIVLGSGVLYLALAQPDRHSLRQIRAEAGVDPT